MPPTIVIEVKPIVISMHSPTLNFPLPTQVCEITEGSMVLVLDIPGFLEPQRLSIQSISGSVAYTDREFVIREIHGSGRTETFKADFAVSGEAGVYSDVTLTVGTAKEVAGRAFGAVAAKLKGA
jgi:hypothetical protein